VTDGPERLTAQDLLMLWPDEYGWSEDIGVLAILDGARLLDGDGRVRVEEVRRRLEPRLALVPRFRQLLYRPRWGLGRPLWVDAAAFDLAGHVRVHPLAPPGDQAQLLAACARLCRRRLDPSRPLWEAWLLPGLPDRRVGLLLRAHHAHGRRGGRGGGLRGAAGHGRRRAAVPRAAVDAGPGPDRGPAAGRPRRGRRGAGAARDGAHRSIGSEPGRRAATRGRRWWCRCRWASPTRSAGSS
jgi:hypothetical protein